MGGKNYADFFSGDRSLRHAKATALSLKRQRDEPLDAEDVRVLYEAGDIEVEEFERLLALALEREGGPDAG